MVDIGVEQTLSLPHARMQRAVGALRLVFAQRDGATKLRELGQSGCLRACFPHGPLTEAVAVNISGGVAGGDQLQISATIGAGGSVVLSAQAAERIYRAVDLRDPARLRTQIIVGDGARAEFLPQETILFDGAALDRALDIELAANSEFLGVEWLVFGRQLRGELIRSAYVRDRISLRRGGTLIWQDQTRLDGDVAALLQRSASGRGAASMASLMYVAPDSAAKLEEVRGAIEGWHAGATCFENLLIVRILAETSASLRKAVIAAMNVLRDARPLPRVWQC